MGASRGCTASLTSQWMSQLKIWDPSILSSQSAAFFIIVVLTLGNAPPNCRDCASHIPTPQWLKSHQSPAGTSGSRYHETSSAFSYRPMSDLAATNTKRNFIRSCHSGFRVANSRLSPRLIEAMSDNLPRMFETRRVKRLNQLTQRACAAEGDASLSARCRVFRI
jgi:hypothetical protein